MRAQRVTEDEVLAAAREEGVPDLDEIEAVVLETNGGFSVLHFGPPSHHPTRSTLLDVPGAAAEGGALVGRGGA